jgi:pyruvate/2-oxoglutarate/acetoin dehydrogenase E1 component
MMTYFDELKKAMNWLGQKQDTLFLGQAVGYPGTAMYNTLEGVPNEKRLEMPVAEEFQMGFSYGMSLQGYVPISIYPRWNFLLCAVSGLVNHIDKYPLLSSYTGKVIIRTGIGSINPLDPQCQHKGNFTEAFKKMCKTVDVVLLEEPEDIFPAYVNAYMVSKRSTILCEVSDYLDENFRLNVKNFLNNLKS